MTRADIAVIGLGVMGANLALNLAEKGNQVVVYNRSWDVTEEFMGGEEAGAFGIRPARDLAELSALLERPRVVMLMVTAGPAVDSVIEGLLPHLDPGDIVIDGGNSLYLDTNRRSAALAQRGIHYMGVGVSGGEEGARHGPSIMAGGDPAAWETVGPMLESIAARAPDGTPCADLVGPQGAGHFVKMVHNGIEYGDMQVIAEAYDLMRRGLGMEPAAIGDVFSSWNQGRLRSYLVEITADILAATEDGTPMVDLILDAAGQKGTGKWTVIASMDLAQPTALVAEAVYARIVSSDPDRRKRAAALFPGSGTASGVTVEDVEAALYASKIISYSQGFRLIRAASDEYGWDVDPGAVAALWRAGCIIRASFLEDITAAYRDEPGLEDLSFAPFFADALRSAEASWRRVVAAAVQAGIPAPAYSSALAYYDGMRSERVPANLIQAQRDYFGAHTFERVDRPRGEFFHREWTRG
ncbi:MAG: decarboxylating NADP(+)-dependent phosphogluconate dehydrogenase [Actinomycetes bacterium]|nr:MAG: phosphogluconate dehydrogenase (NADP(+)-dependent, decarboxylating) [Actinomycetota bacterium]